MKVKKSPKRSVTPSDDVVRYIETISKATDTELIPILQKLTIWKFPRGDLNAWIPVLDRFDEALEGIIKSYDLFKPQNNPFTPKDRELVLEILRVQRILLENCTSRKLFNSYDRCCELLCTSDLEVLHATLMVLLRPAQQYMSHSPIESAYHTKITHRLLTLSRGWDRYRVNGLDLVHLSSSGTFTPPEEGVTITFYPKVASSSSSQGGASVTVNLSDLSPSLYPDELLQRAEDSSMPADDLFSAFNTLRIYFMRSLQERRQLLSIRLLSLATYVCLSRPEIAAQALFLYEPDLITQVGNLLPPSRDVGDSVRAGALIALEAFAKNKSKFTEVLSVLSINVNHGTLLTLLRYVAKGDRSLDLLDAMYSMLGYLIGGHHSPAHANVLTGAGILPILMDLLDIHNPQIRQFIPRTCGLVDSTVYASTQGLALFSQADGVNIIVARIKEEVDSPTEIPDSDLISKENLISYVMTPLKSLLRSIQRLMQASGGTEGLRNLVDGDLPKSIKKIFEENSKYGPRVYSIAINVLATFINNEPTSLSILQELQLPQTLYTQLEADTPRSTDVINAIPNAVSAICLNQSGLDLTKEHPRIISNLMEASLSTDKTVEHSTCQSTGGSLEELARHQPPLRVVIEESVKTLINTTFEAAKSFVPPPEKENEYLLEKIPQDGIKPTEVTTNEPLEKLSKIFQFLEGFLRNATICKNMIKEDGGIIEMILTVPELPCIPIRFGVTDAAIHLSHVFRTITDSDHLSMAEKIIKSVNISMDECSELFSDDSHPRWLAYHEGTSTEDDIKLFRKLKALAIKLTYLGESFMNLSFNHAKSSTNLIKALRKLPNFLIKFGKLHEACFREHAVFRNKPTVETATLVESDPTEPGKESPAKFLASRLHMISAKFFKAVIRLLYVKRNAESSHSTESKKLADQIATILLSHLDVKPIEGKEIPIQTIAIGLTSLYLFDDRSTERHANTLLLMAFEKKKGPEATLKVITGILDVMDAKWLEGVKDDVEINAAVQLGMSICSRFVSSKAITDSPQTSALRSSFNPADMLVNLRLQSLPIIQRVWNSDWLPDSPQPIIKSTVKAYLSIIEGENESSSDGITVTGTTSAPQPMRVRPQPVVPNQAMVDQLVDMGFGRGAAEMALTRAHNNIGAAAELILSAPHIFATIPDPEPAPAAEADPAPATDDGEAQAPAEGEAQLPAGEADAVEGENASGRASPAEDEDKMDIEPEAESDPEKLREQLEEERKRCKEGLADRAIVLLDHVEALVFDLKPAFPTGHEGLTYLFDQITQVVAGYDTTKEKALSARLRLAVVTLSHSDLTLSETELGKATSIFNTLDLETTPRPVWIPALLLFGEAIFNMSMSINEAKIGDDPNAPITTLKDLPGVSDKLADLSQRIVKDKESTREDLLAALRMLVIVSRQGSTVFQHIGELLRLFSEPSAKLQGCQPLLVLIIRHAFEDQSTLATVMKREIESWLTPTRNKVTDISMFVRQLRQAALRDPNQFLDAVEQDCTIVDPKSLSAVYHIRSKKIEKSSTPDKSDPFKEVSTNAMGKSIFDEIVSELGKAIPVVKSTEEGEEAVSKRKDAMVYSGMLLALITEMVGSYIPAKQLFISSLKPTSGDKHSRGGISSLITDFICDVTLTDVNEDSSENGSPAQNRITFSRWTSALIVGLCSDIAPTQDIKEISEELVTVRKQVLDQIAKTLKDTAALTDLNQRYGRMYTLGELIYRLLVAKISVEPRHDESGTHIAKTMIEKNYVGVLTSAAGDVDLNYPGVKETLSSVLKALEHLSKMSIKWGKAEKNKDKATSKDVHSSSDEDDEDDDDDDVDMSEDEQDQPDLYRNSALGMLGGEIDEDSDDEEGDDDDDDMDDLDDMMHFGEEAMDDMDDEVDTEPSEDFDDHDDHEMGEEGDWTDEDDEDNDEDEEELQSVGGDIQVVDPNAVIANPDIVGDGADPWGNEEDMDDDDSEGTDEEGEGMFGEEDMFGLDDGAEYDEEEEGYDDIDEAEEAMMAMPARMGMGGGYHSAPEPLGLWGWDRTPGASSSRNRYSRLFEPESSALFGSSANSAPRSTNNQHPLLEPPSSATTADGRARIRNYGGPGGINELFRHLEETGAVEALAALEAMTAQASTGLEPVRIDLSQDQDGGVVLRIGGRHYHVPATGSPKPSTTPDIASEFAPRSTMQRWLEEMSIIPGHEGKRIGYLVTHLVNRLMPEAKKLAEEEERKQQQIEKEAEEKRKEQEAKEAVEREKEDAKKKEEEEKARAEELATASAVALPETSSAPTPPTGPPPATEDVDMENLTADAAAVQQTSEDEPSADPTEAIADEIPAESLARTVIQIHGRDVDITDTGIDLEFLQALPDDMRAEVVEQHMQEHRRQTAPAADAAAPEASSSINADFLNALPPSIRAEVLMQEAIENARRNRPAPAAAPPAAAPIPARVPGNIIGVGGLPPMPDFDPNMFDGMEDILMAQLQNMGIPMPPLPIAGQGRRPARLGGVPADAPQPSKKPQREAIQLLDKNGIASLVRLLFFPEAFKKGNVFRILVNLCENSTTRADLLNLLISVVQDGSGDLPAVDQSFQQMSLRAAATPKVTPKSKAPETPGPIPLPIFAHLQAENIPTFIAQRCFEALTYIVSANQHAVTFFLTEHEQAVGLKKAPSKKGKGKEKLLPQTKFPIVILLGLLDRPVLLKTSAMLESITALLMMITRPLLTLKQSEEKKEEEEKKQDHTMETDQQASETAAPAITIPIPTPAPAATIASAISQLLDPLTPGPSRTGGVFSFADGLGITSTNTRPATTLTKPPIIPANILRLVVNCMTSGECNNRAFMNSVMLMQNLSAVPDAKEVILQEIKTRAQDLGNTLQKDLAELAAEFTNDQGVDNPMIGKFSSASSNQAQLLRLLKTIDYLYTSKVDSDSPTDKLSENEEKVGVMFASFNFDGMWQQLGHCLGLVEAKGNTDQVAIILLPLVEALMVICKYRARMKEVRSPSLPPMSATSATFPSDPSDLFVSFTTAHRKVLNAIVRNSPSLLSGSFSLLVKNPKVLEFDNKRNWFFQKLKKKRDYQHGSSLHLNIRRQYVFEDSFHALQRRSGDEIKYGKLNVKFYNEDGVDAGGVTREWYSVLARQIFDPNFALFEPCAADAQTYQPNKASAVNIDHLSYFKFVGRVIGKSIYDGRLLDAYFSRAFYKQILGRDVDMRDLESIDPEYHKSLQWMLENDITGVIDQEFTIEDDQFGEKKIVELKDGGAKIPVTEENKQEYVKAVVTYRLNDSIKEQNKAFLDGFYDVIPRHLIQIFEPDQLELLISGITTVDVDELKNATQLSGWKSTDPEISWFWRALRSFSQEERSRFLMFVTSSSRVPLGGFTQLQGASGIQPFQIQKLYSKDGGLPQASTCFNLLLLPKYESYEHLKEKLSFAVTETGGFGKA